TSEAALLWTAAFAPLCGLLVGGSLQIAAVALIGGLVAADRIGHAGRKSAVFHAALFTGVTTAVVVATFAMFHGRLWTWETLAGVLASGLAGAVILPLCALVLSPLLELLFGYVTDIELLKLANFNHPLLKDLIVQAPGTYHHGILIGQLVEAAAREIGANPLLARVGAYYHDIGKGKNPLFFGENQKGENRLDGLTPQASAEIIRRHLAAPAPEKLRALVDRAVQAVVAEGQLHECEITLRDLEQTARSFAESLERILSRSDAPPPRLRVLEAEQLKRA